MLGFKAIAKNTGPGVHGVHFFFITSRPIRNIKCVHEVQFFIFGPFLVLVFATRTLQNYMFCQLVGSANDFPVDIIPENVGETKRVFNLV